LKAVCVFGVSEYENRALDRVQQRLMKSALANIDLNRKEVLEYGCGTGRWINFFKQYGCYWNGVDISNNMLKIAKNHYKGSKIDKVTNNKIPYPDKSFDLVYSVTVIHHNPYEQQEKIVAEMVRVLRDGGYLLLLEDLGENVDFNMFPRRKSSWIDLVAKHGMQCSWHCGARYWCLRTTCELANKWLMQATRLGTRSSKRKEGGIDLKLSSWRKLICYIDSIVVPYLLPLIPSKYETTAIMIFKKV
jgi:ubiquinone/menaquinone biosynthesis C-methylase UbiE